MTRPARHHGGPAWAIVGDTDGVATVALWSDRETSRVDVPTAELAPLVADYERRYAPRWVWHDTATRYGGLLAAGVHVARCHDLRLCHVILRDTSLAETAELASAVEWDAAVDPDAAPQAPVLFDLEPTRGGVPTGIDAALAEFHRQREVLDRADGRLRLLATAESTGALIAAELRSAGLPWDVDTHLRILDDELGTRDSSGVPARVSELAARIRTLLDDPALHVDSPPKLLRSLHRAGILVESTSKWELSEIEHPVIEPLLAYKRLTRLVSANGWAWLDEWVHDGRFRPVYVPGGVVTGRWASSGGGALQLPRQLRAAVRPDPGWVLIVADVAQLEPRVLAAMAKDAAMASAGRGKDLYSGLVDAGVVETRQQAKIAVLGAMYGATTGESGRLLPRLRRAYPRAMALVDDAAQTGESGGRVRTLLGRTSPPPGEGWARLQQRASDPDARHADEELARRSARDRGRFTRNFVVQGTAAEWALVWLAEIRRRLRELGEVSEREAAPRSGTLFATRPHIAFFLHDEIILHVPEAMAEAAARIVQEAAAAAVQLLFPSFPVDMPLDLHVGEDAAK